MTAVFIPTISVNSALIFLKLTLSSVIQVGLNLTLLIQNPIHLATIRVQD